MPHEGWRTTRHLLTKNFKTMRYSGEIITLRDLGVRVKQVNKTAARKLYNEGKTIYLNACNMRLNNPWTSLCPVSKDSEAWNGDTFDGRINEFQYYGCDSERGKYVNFFVEVE